MRARQRLASSHESHISGTGWLMQSPLSSPWFLGMATSRLVPLPCLPRRCRILGMALLLGTMDAMPGCILGGG